MRCVPGLRRRRLWLTSGGSSGGSLHKSLCAQVTKRSGQKTPSQKRNPQVHSAPRRRRPGDAENEKGPASQNEPRPSIKRARQQPPSHAPQEAMGANRTHTGTHSSNAVLNGFQRLKHVHPIFLALASTSSRGLHERRAAHSALPTRKEQRPTCAAARPPPKRLRSRAASPGRRCAGPRAARRAAWTWRRPAPRRWGS